MRKVFAVVIYFAIGVGVVAVYTERHGKTMPNGTVAFAASFLWPSFVAAEIYRAIAPPVAKKGDA